MMSTETRVQIIPVQGEPDTLYHHYPGQTERQDCFIALDLRDGKLWADYDSEIGNAVPADVYHGIVRRYPIPALQPATVNKLMEDIAPFAQIVLDDSEIVWDGSNHVARMGKRGHEAEQDICGDEGGGIIYPEMESDVHVWDAADWLAGTREETRDMVRDMGIDAAYDALQGDGSDEDRPVLEGLRDYLEHLQAEMNEEAE